MSRERPLLPAAAGVFQALGRRLVELLFPLRANCLGCGDPLGADGEFLCEACQEQLIPEHQRRKNRCQRCGTPLGERGRCNICHGWPPDTVDWARYVYLYRRPIDRLIQRMKYSGVRILAPWMADEIHALMASEGLTLPDVVAAVPMHKRRLRKRGFNHADAIAAELARRIGRPLIPALRRTRNTRQQARLSRDQRLHNLDGAFAAGFEATGFDVQGLCVLLIDDVRTSGATACACAVALRAAGAREIALLTLAGTRK